MLQYYGRIRGVTVDRTPKCHPELAGEGVEYAWGAAKLFYRRQPLSLKRNKESFYKLVEKSTDSSENGVLNREVIRKFAARARKYMLAYIAIDKQQDEQHNTDDEELKISYSLIEKCVKHFKSHRSAADFDNSFIKSVVMQMWSQTAEITVIA